LHHNLEKYTNRLLRVFFFVPVRKLVLIVDGKSGMAGITVAESAWDEAEDEDEDEEDEDEDEDEVVEEKGEGEEDEPEDDEEPESVIFSVLGVI